VRSRLCDRFGPGKAVDLLESFWRWVQRRDDILRGLSLIMEDIHDDVYAIWEDENFESARTRKCAMIFRVESIGAFARRDRSC